MVDYRREVDGLRALAVVPVILFHAGFETFGGGFVGVDVFFVISGYLITSIILAEKEAGDFSLLGFYERRVRRILPALFLVMAASIPFAWAWLLPNDMKDFSRSLVAVSVFASNVFFLRESGYFETAAELKPLLHTWSLAVEEQYYLLFPLFLILMWRFARRWTVPALAIIAVSSLALAHWGVRTEPAAAFFLLPTRAWELAIGAFIAFRFSRRRRLEVGVATRQVGSAVGLGLIVHAVFAFSDQTPFPGLNALVPTVGAALIILMATPDTLVGRMLATRAFVGVGLISYSAYLWHQPLFAFARHGGAGASDVALFVALAVLSLLLAYLSWRFVEQPIRRRSFLTRRGVFSAGLVLSAAFIVFGYVGNKTKGFEGRFERAVRGDIGYVEFQRHLDQEFLDCEPGAIADQALRWKGSLRCKQSKPGLPDLVLLGDSHAEHLFIGLAEAKADLNVAYYILDGLPYESNPQYRAIFDELLGNRRPQGIVLTMHYAARANADDARLGDEMMRTVARLVDAGKKVAVVGDVPRYPVDPGICVFRGRSGAIPAACSLSAPEADAQRRVYRPALTRLSRETGVPYLDIDAPLCNESGCSMVLGDAILYRDNNHLNIPGSRLVGSHLAGRLPF